MNLEVKFFVVREFPLVLGEKFHPRLVDADFQLEKFEIE